MKIFDELGGIWRGKMTRKDFLKACVTTGVCVGSSIYAFGLLSKYEAYASIGEKRGMKEALYYVRLGDDAVKCLLCPNQCVLSNGQRGFCRVREPLDGKLYTLVYELVCSVHIDPIEKKPLYHFLPGSASFSIATAGCNSRCKYCQNWTISQRQPEETVNRVLRSDELVSTAYGQGCASIAYTYNEPVVFYEYMLNAGDLAKKRGISNVMVTGGKINQEPLKQLCGVIDAANIDLKGFNDNYLTEICAQNLDNILQTIVAMKKAGVWVELTNLIVPTLNDNMDDIRKMVRWIKANVGPDVPLHFSRFWPQYKLRSLYPTPIGTLMQARNIALEEGIHFVYVGNAPEAGADNTVCPKCGKTVIKRAGYRIEENDIKDGACAFCGYKIAGRWE